MFRWLQNGLTYVLYCFMFTGERGKICKSRLYFFEVDTSHDLVEHLVLMRDSRMTYM